MCFGSFTKSQWKTDSIMSLLSHYRIHVINFLISLRVPFFWKCNLLLRKSLCLLFARRNTLQCSLFALSFRNYRINTQFQFQLFFKKRYAFLCPRLYPHHTDSRTYLSWASTSLCFLFFYFLLYNLSFIFSVLLPLVAFVLSHVRK